MPTRHLNTAGLGPTLHSERCHDIVHRGGDHGDLVQQRLHVVFGVVQDALSRAREPCRSLVSVDSKLLPKFATPEPLASAPALAPPEMVAPIAVPSGPSTS